MTTVQERPPGGQPTRRPGALHPWQSVALVAVLLVAVEVGVGSAGGGVRSGAVLLIIGALGVLLLALASRSLLGFLLAVVAVRPLLDWPKSAGLDERGLIAAGTAALIVGVGGSWLALRWLAPRFRGLRPAARLVPPSALAVALIVLVATMALSTVLSGDRATSAQALARTVTAVVLLVVAEQVARTRREAVALLVAALASAAGPVLLGLYQAASGNYLNTADGVGRVTGSFVHPNSFGFYLALVLVMATALWRHLPGAGRVGLACLLIPGSLCLLLTYSRGGWLSLTLGLLVVGLLQSRALLVLLPAGAGLLLAAVPSITGRLADLQTTQSATGTAGNSLLWRFDQWSASLDLVDGRWVTGIGPGLVDVLASLPPHNDAVRLYVEGGALGLAAYSAVLLVLLGTAVRTVRAAPAGLPRGVAVGAAGCSVAFVVNSLGANLITQIVILTYLFVFMVAARRLAATTQWPSHTGQQAVA